MKTVIHLFLTESRRLGVLLGIYGICWILFQTARAIENNLYRSSQSLFLLWLMGAVTLAALFLGDNLVRRNPHWRFRPITRGDWLGSRALFVGAWFLVPVAGFQFWMALDSGLAFDVAITSVVEALLKTLAFIAVVAAIVVQMPNWFWSIGLGIGLFVVAMTGVSFPNPFDPSTSVEAVSAAGVPVANGRVWGWFWIACLGLGIGNVLIALAGAGRALRLPVFGGSALALVGIFWWAEATDLRPPPKVPDGSELMLRKKSASHDGNSQGIYTDLHLRGLEPGTFVEITGLGTRSGNYRQPGRGWGIPVADAGNSNKLTADEALIGTFSRDSHLWRSAGWYYGGSEFLQSEPLSKSLGDEKLEDVEVRGESFRWVEIARLPVRVGATARGKDVFAEIIGFRRGDPAKVSIRMWRPSLHLAPQLTATRRSHRWRIFRQTAVCMVHEELNEIFLLSGGEFRDGSEFNSSQIPFSGVQQATGSYVVPRVHAWSILWPDVESDFERFRKWSEGAELRIFTTEYAGPVTASFEEG